MTLVTESYSFYISFVQQDNLDEHIAIIGIGRRDYSNEEFRDQVKSSIQKHVKDTNRIDEFMNHVFYHKTDVSDERSYESLLQFSNQLDKNGFTR